jgi:hypothetical protein
VLPLELEHQAQRWFEGSGSKLSHAGVATVYRRAPQSRGRRRFVVTVDSPDRPPAELFIYRGKFGSGANIAVRARALAELGGFDEALGTGTPSGGGEDLYLFSQLLYAGRGLAFEPGAALRHRHRTDVDDLRRSMFSYGTGYTAMLAALVLADRRHVAGLAHYGIAAAAVLLQRRQARRDVAYPGSLARAEWRGLLLGPWAYLRSRRMLRRGGLDA